MGAAPDDVRGEVARRLGAAVGDGDVTLDIRGVGGEPAYRGGKSNPLVRALLAAIREASGTPRFVVKTGTSDMNVVAPAWPGTPVVAYGPGDSSLDHTPREHADVRELLRSVAVLRGALRRLFVAW